MEINEIETKQAKILTEKLLKHKDKLSYINIGSNNEYLGWVADLYDLPLFAYADLEKLN